MQIRAFVIVVCLCLIGRALAVTPSTGHPTVPGANQGGHKDVKVTFGDNIIRDNNANFPRSLCPGSKRDVNIIIENLPINKQVDFSIASKNVVNGGSASIVGNSFLKGNGVIQIMGGTQTSAGDSSVIFNDNRDAAMLGYPMALNPQFAGSLYIVAKFGQKVVGRSQGFTVCSHPVTWTHAYGSDIYQDTSPFKRGLHCDDNCTSDSGPESDLDWVGVQELVGSAFSPTTPPFAKLVGSMTVGRGWARGSEIGTDDFTFGKGMISAGPAGTSYLPQVHIFGCARCGLVAAIPQSGYTISHDVVDEGGIFGSAWNSYTRVQGTPNVAGGVSASAGLGNAKSLFHPLP